MVLAKRHRGLLVRRVDQNSFQITDKAYLALEMGFVSDLTEAI